MDPRRSRTSRWTGALLALALLAAPAAGAVDWDAAADVRDVTVITTNADGTAKETTVWLAVHDGQGYIRTSDTRWWKNIARDDRVVLRIGGEEHPLRAVRIADPELFDAVTAVFREKYGFVDVLAKAVRFGEVKIMRLDPR